ncbi:hypothetical protein [Frigidibacter oleivorans]|uniref:hypothetical protein n=1 Tax=Frigidibacter oleivorans TaxID=2487129 RepID=UPI000F8E466C|nr:hypothetical protein [Frigidibacter oleivorans]
MDPDILLTLGLVAALLSVPSLVSAWSDRRRPWFALTLALAGGAAIGAALVMAPGRYDPAAIPDVVLATFARLLR